MKAPRSAAALPEVTPVPRRGNSLIQPKENL
jgi:hypothetical protein